MVLKSELQRRDRKWVITFLVIAVLLGVLIGAIAARRLRLAFAGTVFAGDQGALTEFNEARSSGDSRL